MDKLPSLLIITFAACSRSLTYGAKDEKKSSTQGKGRSQNKW